MSSEEPRSAINPHKELREFLSAGMMREEVIHDQAGAPVVRRVLDNDQAWWMGHDVATTRLSPMALAAGKLWDLANSSVNHMSADGAAHVMARVRSILDASRWMVNAMDSQNVTTERFPVHKQSTLDKLAEIRSVNKVEDSTQGPGFFARLAAGGQQ